MNLSFECLLLTELESNPTLAQLSVKLAKDISVISRDLKKISEKSSVLEKVHSRWVLTQSGRELCSWTKKIAIEQNEILGREYTITIATTREFASRILAKNIQPLLKNNVKFKIMTHELGIEEALLNGQADFGFDCGKPHDPLIAFKPVLEEQIITVTSTSYARKNNIKKIDQLSSSDFLFYTRLNPLSFKHIDIKNAMLSSNDISVIRNLLLDHYGWATLPYYTLSQEIESHKLQIISGGDIKGFKYGVWWLRGRPSLEPWIKHAENWLKDQNLMENSK